MKQNIVYNNAYKSNSLNPFRKKPHFTQFPDRKIITNIPDTQLTNNKISTAKYFLASFVLFNFLQQFSKPANLYFLIIGLLQLVPAISISEGKPTMYLPLSIVVILSMIKDFIEDLKRHKSDKQENEKLIQVLGAAGFVKKKSESIRVGQIIKIYKNQYFPCDLLLLKNSEQSKFVYVETKNLDGQTNLKLKKKHPDLLQLQQASQQSLFEKYIEINYQKPNPFLYTFNGNIKHQNKKLILDNNNILLRGCSLKITNFIIGVAIYTGHDTKIMLNSTSAKPKRSSLQNLMNSYFKMTFLIQFALTFLCSLVYAILNSTNYQYQGYLQSQPQFFKDMFFNWGTWFIIFASFVPISLLVTLELIRYFQGTILQKDQNCKSKYNDTQLSVQSSNLNQQLGQINFILSDKTGTLTKNIMNFRYLCAGGICYGQQQTISQQDLKNYPKVSNVEFSDLKLFKHLTNKNHHNYLNLKKYMIHLSLCHCIITQKNQYNASSPDQLALVNFAKFCGYTFIGTTDDNYMVFSFEGLEHRYKLLHVLQFNSDRKRMSVIVKNQEGSIQLLCKGADSVLQNRMTDSKYKDLTFKALQKYAVHGYRTLMLCSKKISQNQYNNWQQKYMKVLSLMSNDRHQRIEQMQSQIQRNMELIGITAIQDKLQDKVPETIKLFQKANIVVWMLTGDKKQTAISIGYSAGLIQADTQKIVLDCPSQNIQALLTNVQSILSVISTKRTLILSGSTLLSLPDHLKNRIANLSLSCKSVICCRVSPKQKQQLVEMVKQHGRVLAIGDGANDVNMINKSNVGVGIKGHQGGQAARAADYVVGQFQILRQLVLNHGKQIYVRNANVILFNIYKNMVIILPIFWYGFVSMFSGSYIYDNWIFQFYNVIFTFLPIMIYSLMDREHQRSYNIQNPQLYVSGQTNSHFNNKILLNNVFICAYESLIISVLVFGFLHPTLVTTNHMMFQTAQGMVIFTIIIIICNIRPLIFSYRTNLFFIGSCILGVVLYYVTYISVDSILYTDSRNTLSQTIVTAQYWILLVFGVTATQGMHILYLRYVQFNKNARKKDTLLNKDNQTIQMADSNRQNLRELQIQRMGSDILEQKKVYTGYAFDEDEGKQNH